MENCLHKSSAFFSEPWPHLLGRLFASVKALRICINLAGKPGQAGQPIMLRDKPPTHPHIYAQLLTTAIIITATLDIDF